MGSPLTLAKSKRWLPAIESSRGSPDQCSARECVQERRRAATKRRFRQLVDRTGIVFSALLFSVPPWFCPRHAPGFVSRPNWLTTVCVKSCSLLLRSRLHCSLLWFCTVTCSVRGKPSVVLHLPSTLSLSNQSLQHPLSCTHVHMSLHSITWC